MKGGCEGREGEGAARRETGYRRDRRLLRHVSRAGSSSAEYSSRPHSFASGAAFDAAASAVAGASSADLRLVRALQASARAHASRGASLASALEEAASLGLVIPAALAEAAAALQRHARADASGVGARAPRGEVLPVGARRLQGRFFERLFK